MAWLVSFESTTWFLDEHGLSPGGEGGYVRLIPEHPAVWVAENRRELVLLEQAKWQKGDPLRFTHEITALHLAVEVPEGLLSQSQLALFD